MGEKRNMFLGLGWEKEIRRLGDPHVSLNPSPERDRSVAKGYDDDYELTGFV